MTVKLTEKKKQKNKNMCMNILYLRNPTVRVVAQLLGYFSTSFIGVKFGLLHYRSLERDKIKYLQYNKGNFDKCMLLSAAAINEI